MPTFSIRLIRTGVSVLACTLVLVLVHACQRQSARGDAIEQPLESQATLVVSAVRDTQLFARMGTQQIADVELKNISSDTLWCWTNRIAHDSPGFERVSYLFQALADTGWAKPDPVPWCGTGFSQRLMPPGSAVMFQAVVFDSTKSFRIGVGIDRMRPHLSRSVLWSQQVDPSGG